MATMSDDLTARITAALDQLEECNDWPHRRSCQMLKPVPEGFPFPTFTCNCDAADLWMNIMEAHREIAEACRDAIDNGNLPAAAQARIVLAILAKAHRIEA